MSDESNQDRTGDEALPQHDAGGRRRASGPRITGRSFAGTKFASDERREQTADHRGASQGHKLDAGGSRSDENRDVPADES